MRRQQQRRRRARGGWAQCVGGEEGSQTSSRPAALASASASGRKKPPAPSCCSLSGAESPREMARRKSPGRFSPARGFLEAYSSEPEVAGGEGRRGRRGEECGRLAGRPGKSRISSSLRRPKASAPRRLSAWQPGGEGCATPGTTTSCTTLYGGDWPSPRAEEPPLLLREEPWASPVPRPLDYAADFPADASKPASRCPSSSFSSFAPLEHKGPPKLEKKELSRRDWRELCGSSPSLVDLMHSLRQYEEEEEEEEEEAAYHPDPGPHPHHRHPQKQPRKAQDPQIRLQDLVDKRYEDLLPERDKKIAALMLARHQEQEEMKDRQLQVSEAWENLRRKEKHKARLDKERRYHVADSLEQWQRDRDQRISKLRLEEQQLLAARERDMMFRDKKWKKLAKEQECRRREKCESARLQAEYRKRCQEKQLWEKKLSERSAREQSSHAYKEKMLQALEKRLMKEMERKRRKTDMNEYRRAQHMHNKDQMDDRLKADELYKRLCIEQKLQRSQEILEQLLEERNRELKERSFKEEEQGMIAKVRAKETEEEKRRRKEMLLQIAEMKIQQAREIMSKNIDDRAQHTKEMNCLKERNHHCRKQKLDYDEKCNLRELQEALRRKDQKSNQILRHKDTAIEESRKLAKASYDLREKVRDLITHNSFDQMALDAHRNASVLRGL